MNESSDENVVQRLDLEEAPIDSMMRIIAGSSSDL